MTKSGMLQISRSVALVMAAALACGASFAEKPEWAGSGKHGKGGKHEQIDQGEAPHARLGRGVPRGRTQTQAHAAVRLRETLVK